MGKGNTFYPKAGIESLLFMIVPTITDYRTSKDILKHIGEETVRPPPLSMKTSTANIPDNVFWDAIPSDDVYFHAPEYVN